MSYNIGIDFGGVLGIHDKGDCEHINTSINMPGEIEALNELKSQNHNLYLISYCGKKRATETRDSMDNNNVSCLFQAKYYVKNKKFKSNICNDVGIHIMIDDRIGILNSIKQSNKNILTILFAHDFEESNLKCPHKIAKNWNQVLEIINKAKINKKMFENKTKINKDVSELCHIINKNFEK